jgi:hypothetical protein
LEPTTTRLRVPVVAAKLVAVAPDKAEGANGAVAELKS